MDDATREGMQALTVVQMRRAHRARRLARAEALTQALHALRALPRDDRRACEQLATAIATTEADRDAHGMTGAAQAVLRAD